MLTHTRIGAGSSSLMLLYNTLIRTPLTLYSCCGVPTLRKRVATSIRFVFYNAYLSTQLLMACSWLFCHQIKKPHESGGETDMLIKLTSPGEDVHSKICVNGFFVYQPGGDFLTMEWHLHCFGSLMSCKRIGIRNVMFPTKPVLGVSPPHLSSQGATPMLAKSIKLN